MTKKYKTRKSNRCGCSQLKKAVEKSQKIPPPPKLDEDQIFLKKTPKQNNKKNKRRRRILPVSASPPIKYMNRFFWTYHESLVNVYFLKVLR